ncbi:hypothetical protein G6011_01622 [Alternaria panax]|uniref:Uncharacterized protein n=1 Tax=Alternaria panax TaxID=48097 RepID=A0AAD4ILA9_9PLEO|nr:hypothetical protein G6011_01622 [Alternaria panax]
MTVSKFIIGIIRFSNPARLTLITSQAPIIFEPEHQDNVTVEDNNFEYWYRSTHVDVFYSNADTAGRVPIAGGCQTIKRPGVAPADRGCSPASFNCTLDGGFGIAGSYSLALEQTVTLNGTEVTVHGAKPIEIQCTSYPEEDLPYKQCKD